MKIGLVCNFYIYNYGSVLQSYALEKYIEYMQVPYEVINYRDVANKKQKIKIIFKLKLKNILNIKKLIEKIKLREEVKLDKQYKSVIEKRKNAYDAFIDKYFTLSKCCNSIEDVKKISDNYDVILLSSDQLWGPADLIRDYHTLRNFPKKAKKIAYATSFGVARLPRFLHKSVNKFIPQIECVSVREKSGQKIIKEICNRDVPVVVDPTLLVDVKEWHKLLSQQQCMIKGKYVFCYFLGENSDHIGTTVDFCKKNNLKMVSILHTEKYNVKTLRFADEYPDGVGPAEFLNLIYNAEYVISDSFHASVFSILFHKKFVVFDRYKTGLGESRNTRIDNLLELLGVEERHYVYQCDLDAVINKDINWSVTERRLKEERTKSEKYLCDSLNIMGDHI